VLICGGSANLAGPDSPFVRSPLVAGIEHVLDIRTAKSVLEKRAISAIFLSLLDVGLYEGCDFIFSVRRKYPNVVFVLCVPGELRSIGGDSFFQGERSRLLHYYSLDLLTPATHLQQVVDSRLESCMMDLALSPQ